MPKAYWTVLVDASDEAIYPRYLTENRAILERYGGRPLNRRGPVETIDGRSVRKTMIEFPNLDAAVKCYADPQYREANPRGGPVSVADVVAVEKDEPLAES